MISSTRSDYEKYISYKALNTLLKTKVEQITSLAKEKIDLENRFSLAKKTLSNIKSTRKIAESEFKDCYQKYLYDLNVDSFNSKLIEPFKKLDLSGSLYVRSSLAFFFSVLSAKAKLNPDKYNFPLVIDSPREGEQDEENSKDIFNFVLGDKNSDSQTIIASIDAKKYINESKRNSINVIVLERNNSGHVMTKEEYSTNKSEIESSLAYFKNISKIEY